MQDYDKKFIDWTIAQLKFNRKSVQAFIENLRNQGKGELAEYAESVQGSIAAVDLKNYESAFQKSIVDACMTSGDPRGTAKAFFKALNIDPKKTEMGRKIAKALGEARFFLLK